MKPTVYIETTIPSYLVARPSRDLVLAGHQQSTRDFWDNHLDEIECFISPYVVKEAAAGEPYMAQQRLNAIRGMALLRPTKASDLLAETLLAKLSLPTSAEVDAYHIAIAAAYQIDFLLTWNCKHINNMQLLRRIEAICRHSGHIPPVIGTPEELFP